tara:strand:+ start:6579 stop:6998 length:420 start_codon:yes stop_codon:yes gene_type:complete
MPYKPKQPEGYADRTVTVRKAYKDANFEEKDMSERVEEQIPISTLVTDGHEVASVTASVSTKVSDSVRYGDGQWDKVPYSVEVFSSVTVKCDQTQEGVTAGHSMAYDLAWEASREHIGGAVLGHVSDIRERLYKGKFDD